MVSERSNYIPWEKKAISKLFWVCSTLERIKHADMASAVLPLVYHTELETLGVNLNEKDCIFSLTTERMKSFLYCWTKPLKVEDQ
jgi:hypothetical protein